MNAATFKSLSEEEVRAKSVSQPLLALWHAGQGHWDAAHDIVQDASGGDAAWVHAYLHREEGDQFNAGYWYRRAGKTMPSVSLAEEWHAMVEELLQSSS